MLNPYLYKFLILNKLTQSRSIDIKMRDFLAAYGSQNPNIPGPFQVPPANLPTNISGGAVGYFVGYDVKRFRYTFK
jgi:hypothetical protein